MLKMKGRFTFLHNIIQGADPGFREGGWLAVELLNFACEIHCSSEASDHFHVVTWWLHTTMSEYECIDHCLGFYYSDEGGGGGGGG